MSFKVEKSGFGACQTNALVAAQIRHPKHLSATKNRVVSETAIMIKTCGEVSLNESIEITGRLKIKTRVSIFL